MKIFSLIVTFCFTLNVFASTNTIKAFENALDEYHYAVSVEWDQKDPAFQKEKAKEFIERVQPLMQSGAINQQDIINMIEKRISNKSVVDALKLKIALSGDFKTSEELVNFFQNSSTDFYSTGASWNGEIKIPVAVVLVAITALGIAMWYSATHGCQEYQQVCDETRCRNNYDVCLEYGYVGPHL